MPDINFDSTIVEPVGSMELLPVGDYPVIISGSEYRMTKPKAGREPSQYLALTFKVIDGEHKNRKLFASLHINNPNPEAKDIARRTLSAICACVDVPRPSKTEELHDRPLVVKVMIRPANEKEGYEAQNEVKGYRRIDGKPLSSQASNAVPSSAPAGGKRPWEKK